MLQEPRGGVFRHVNLLVPPKDPSAHTGWIIMEPQDTPPMSGSNSICVATVLLEKVQGARAFYETIIRRGDEVLAEIKSSWCSLDAETLRPARLAASVVERFFPKDEQPH